jgi:hypothetical protein
MKRLQKIEVSQQDIWDATRPNIEQNKKKYSRKEKYKKRW